MKSIWLVIPFSVLILMLGCSKEFPVQPHSNRPPVTFLWLFPDSTIAPGVSRQRIHWWGEDPDGYVVGYLFAVAQMSPPITHVPDTLSWTWTTRNDSLLAFPLLTVRDTFTVFVRAVDNTFATSLHQNARVRMVPQPYWDTNDDGVFDPSVDVDLPSLAGAMDPNGANQWMPLRNQPPSLRFVPDPKQPARPLQLPETTYTVVTVSWLGTDPDGDDTIIEYHLALNDTTDWVTVPGHVDYVTLHVPRARSDAATDVVDADVYTGTFLNRQLIRTLPGLRLDALNTLYVRAKDIAGEYSPTITLPGAHRHWYVRKPRSRMLVVADDIFYGAPARNLYRSTFSEVVLPSGNLGNYDVLDIGRGLTPSRKLVLETGDLVQSFVDPALPLTLGLYEFVFWYTDQYPSLGVAQSALFFYTRFLGGKVIFSTTFLNSIDPRGALVDFAPLDSIGSVDLSHPALPRYGDNVFPGGHRVLADSTNPSNIYPPLIFNPAFAHSVIMRPLFKQPDARFIYRMQDDTLRGPTIPPALRYTFLITRNNLRSVDIHSNGSAVGVGDFGTIVHSNDGGITWSLRPSGTDKRIRSAVFLTSSDVWAVGDSGMILTSNNGGVTWSDRSLLTFQNFFDIAGSTGNIIVVGTSGLIIRSLDGGNSWEQRPSGTTRRLRAVASSSPTNFVAVGDSVRILHSSDGGGAWEPKSVANLPGAFLGDSLFSIAIVPGSNLVYAVGSRGLIVRSENGGQSWSRVSPFTNAQLLSISFADGMRGWITGASGGFWWTADGGSTWNALSIHGTTQALHGVRFLPGGEGVIVGTGGIILRGTGYGNSAANWSFQPRGNLNVGVVDGQRRFVFIGLPLHLLNGPLGTSAPGLLRDFFQHVFDNEFN